MTVKLPCAVVRDLLPLYAEKMTEGETNRLVDEHMENCAECRRKLSEIETKAAAPVETAAPLKALKKEIQKRRWFAAAIAALLVFVTVCAVFSHANEMRLVPWEDGLVVVKGVEARPAEDVYGSGGASEAGADVNALVLDVDGRINGTRESLIVDDDGVRTLILEGWSTDRRGGSVTRERGEMLCIPVPDRVIYSSGDEQTLVWGAEMDGGVVVLPRLALAYYLLMAVALAVLFGLLWLLLRNRDKSRVFRQLFFAPVAYILAHFLIKGFRTTSFFMERDFLMIVVIAIALYAALTLLWQVWLRRRKEA